MIHKDKFFSLVLFFLLGSLGVVSAAVPIFYNITDNNASQVSSGQFNLSVNINFSNGTQWVQINNANYSLRNFSSGNYFSNHFVNSTLVSSVNITVLFPNSSSDQIVSSGTVTENTWNSMTQAVISSSCLSNISSKDGTNCTDISGSTSLDAFFLWNITLPGNSTTTNWLFLEANISQASNNGTDTIMLAAWNWTRGSWQNLSVSKVPNRDVFLRLVFNISGGIRDFINDSAGNRTLFAVRTNGTVNTNTDISVELMTVQTSSNQSYIDSSVISGVTLSSGTHDYVICSFMNDSFAGQNCTSTRYFTVNSSSCSYSGSGDWDIDCSSNCSISSNVNLAGNRLILRGIGKFTLDANITNVASILKSRPEVSSCPFYKTLASKIYLLK
jgi:hypothetical protein